MVKFTSTRTWRVLTSVRADISSRFVSRPWQLRVQGILYKAFYFISHALQRNKPATKKNHILFLSLHRYNWNAMQTSDSIVIIPTYNEKENIENIIRAVFGLKKTFHILVIEDNSPDGTADIVRRLQRNSRTFVHDWTKGKLGLGNNLHHRLPNGLSKKGYDYIFEMDADFKYNPNDLPRLYKACHEERGRYPSVHAM